ncbi:MULTISPECIES: hypothetical protein [Acinetobacter]|uniref:hypothetical protein n=1 Tax=Acinetobacter TaxID=469 RepID=UPI00028E97E5|nr:MULTISPECIES: hypothetical protein [Acinetobacter]MDP7851031.1 hypothetical protein [Acinetobacter baumannii]BBL22187.1 hypothetical protein ACRAD_28580 [Acinetobacter radioresistens DSM 6976 = NBRC 102413 = CIP 103788]
MKSKEVKLIIRKDADPEILKWANTLKYGAFPKLMLEILRWYETNGLLVRGGVNHPDLLPPKIPLNQDSPDAKLLYEMFSLLKENNELLKSGGISLPTEQRLINEPFEIIDPKPVEALSKDVVPEPSPLVHDQVEEAESEEEPSLPFTPPAFKIYR